MLHNKKRRVTRLLGEWVIGLNRITESPIHLITLMLLLASVSAHAATYYVRTDGNNANNGLTNASNGAWQTINFAASHVAAGDVVRVQAGMYAEKAAPGVSGTAGNPVTLVADGLVTTCGMSFSSKSYIRVIGFTINAASTGCTPNSVLINISGTNTGLEFWNNAFDHSDNANAFVVNSGSFCNSCIIFGGSIHDVGNTSAQVALNITGDDTFVGYVDFATVCYIGVGQSGHRMRFVNLNFSGMIQCAGAHPDFYYPQGGNTFGFSNDLVESNFGIGTVTSHDNKGMHVQNQTSVSWVDNVWRSNIYYDLGSGGPDSYATPGSVLRTRHYNNDYLYCDAAQLQTDPQFDACAFFSPPTTASYFNNLNYKAWSDAARTSGVEVASTNGNPENLTWDYNLAYDPNGPISFLSSWLSQAHEQSNVNPQLTNIANNDFTLQSNSGARGTGGPLTTATSCSGTTLNVASTGGAFFFGSNGGNLPQYGGNLVPGDFITVGANTYQVASVSGDAITLTGSITCSNGDPVYYGTSATQDIGAYPYKPGGYTLTASYSQSGGIATVVPSDPSLVRFVVCYQNAIPTTVDNAAPYTCPMGSGTFQAIVYPRYASQTLQVVATNGAPPSTCDLNDDGSTNVSDVQLCVNQAIGVTSCTSGDINHDGSCNVIDVQRDVNAALGGQCVTQ